MPRALQIVPSIPTLSAAVVRFLARPRFAARTRESYAQDLAPLVSQLGPQPVTSLTTQVGAAFLAGQEHLGASTFNRRDADARDRALFWLMYDGGLRCQEALAIKLEDIDWTERAIRVQGKGDRAREMFFSRRVSRYLDDYLKRRGAPTIGPLFITMRKARPPRRADVTADGHARLSYRQADTLWKKYTPGWDLHQLRHTAISARAAQGYNEIELKRFSGHLSLLSLEVYIAHNGEAAKRKARDWEHRDQAF
jgi:integrase